METSAKKNLQASLFVTMWRQNHFRIHLWLWNWFTTIWKTRWTLCKRTFYISSKTKKILEANNSKKFWRTKSKRWTFNTNAGWITAPSVNQNEIWGGQELISLLFSAVQIIDKTEEAFILRGFFNQPLTSFDGYKPAYRQLQKTFSVSIRQAPVWNPLCYVK